MNFLTRANQIFRKRPGRTALLAGMVFVLAACSTYPLGMSEKEWVLLTPEQQMAARMKQADLNRANAVRRTAQADARRQRYAAQEAAERRRIEELYRSARYGDVLECVVEGGTAGFRRGWRNYTPASFTLARGEVKSVSLSAGDRRGKFWAKYSADGQSMKLCYGKPKSNGGRYCASVNGQSQDFSVGVTRRVSVRKIFRDANVVCAYRPEHDMPQAYVQRHNTTVYRVIHKHHYKKRAKRTHVVIHKHYNRPVRNRTKTVIHKHYREAPETRKAPRVVHKHYYKTRPRQTARQPDYEEPRKRNGRKWRRVEPSNQTPDYSEPQHIDRGEQISPRSYERGNAQSRRAANPRSAVKKDRRKYKKARRRGRNKNNYEEWVDDYLTSAPVDDDNRGRGRRNRN